MWTGSLINLISRPSGSAPLEDFISEIACWKSEGWNVENEYRLLLKVFVVVEYKSSDDCEQ